MSNQAEMEAALLILRQAGLEAVPSKMAPDDIVGGSSSSEVPGGQLFHKPFHLRREKDRVIVGNGGQGERWPCPSMEAAARLIVKLRRTRRKA